jgi:hypothetical protein
VWARHGDFEKIMADLHFKIENFSSRPSLRDIGEMFEITA